MLDVPWLAGRRESLKVIRCYPPADVAEHFGEKDGPGHVERLEVMPRGRSALARSLRQFDLADRSDSVMSPEFVTGGRTAEKVAAVMRAAEREPHKFGALLEEMDRTRKVDGVYRKLRQAQCMAGFGRSLRTVDAQRRRARPIAAGSRW